MSKISIGSTEDSITVTFPIDRTWTNGIALSTRGPVIVPGYPNLRINVTLQKSGAFQAPSLATTEPNVVTPLADVPAGVHAATQPDKPKLKASKKSKR